MTERRNIGEGMRVNISSVINVLVAVCFFSILSIQAHALTPGQVFNKVKDAVVVVKALDAQGKLKGFGSGVLLPSGKIATNCHVVAGGASYKVGRGKQLVVATLYAEDGDKDICILDAKGIKGKPAQLGKAANLNVGDPVYAVGAPRGLELSLSDGIIAQLRGGPPPFIQTTAAISPGSSGGGLFNREGRLVGLTTLYIEGGQSLNFAMPVEWIGEVKPGRKTVAGGRSQTEWVKRAIVLEKLKDWQGLLDWCLKWKKSNPEDADALYNLVFAYHNLNRSDDANEAMHQGLRIIDANRHFIILNNPENAAAWYKLGVNYDKFVHSDDAIEAYRQAIRINPEYADAWNSLGLAYRRQMRQSEAIEAYRQAIQINPKHAKAWYNLGFAYAEFKRYDDAIDAYRQALSIDQKNADTWSNLGVIYGELNRRNDQIEAYRQALRINPEDAVTWFSLGATYGMLNRHNEEIEAYRQVLRINPSDTMTWFFLAQAYDFSGNKTAALDAVQELRRLDPEKGDMLFNLIVPR